MHLDVRTYNEYIPPQVHLLIGRLKKQSTQCVPIVVQGSTWITIMNPHLESPTPMDVRPRGLCPLLQKLCVLPQKQSRSIEQIISVIAHIRDCLDHSLLIEWDKIDRAAQEG